MGREVTLPGATASTMMHTRYLSNLTGWWDISISGFIDDAHLLGLSKKINDIYHKWFCHNYIGTDSCHIFIENFRLIYIKPANERVSLPSSSILSRCMKHDGNTCSCRLSFSSCIRYSGEHDVEPVDAFGDSILSCSTTELTTDPMCHDNKSNIAHRLPTRLGYLLRTTAKTRWNHFVLFTS